MDRDEALQTMLELYDRGVRLRSDDIAQESPGLFHALYRTNSDVPKLFPSIGDARSSLADLLVAEGRDEDASTILQYNERVSANKMTEEQKQERREELSEKLRSLIDEKKDVSLRYMQGVDRSFVSQAKRYFGSYRNMFEANGFVYEDYMRVRCRKTKDDYMADLISVVKEGNRLDKFYMIRKHPLLVDRLSDLYDGYYDALQNAAAILQQNDEIDHYLHAAKDWQELGKNHRQKRVMRRRKNSLKKIKVVDDASVVEESYQNYISTEEFSKAVGCTRENIVNLLHKFAHHAIKVVEGKRHYYLFDPEVVNIYQSINNQERDLGDIRSLAERLDVGYSRVRNLCHLLGYDEKKDSKKEVRELSRMESNTIKNIIDISLEKNEQLLAQIKDSKEYSAATMDLLGFPRSKFVREGRLIGGATISGRELAHYISQRNPTMLHSELISCLFGDLYTTSHAVRTFGIERSTMLYRIQKLSKDVPGSCIRVRKSPARSKYFIRSKALAYLQDFENRGELALLDLLSEKEVLLESRLSVQEVDDCLEELLCDESIDHSLQSEAFSLLRRMDSSLGFIDDVPRSALFVLSRYLDINNYTTLETDKSYSVLELETLLEDNDLNELQTRREHLLSVLYKQNLPLIGLFTRKYSVNPGQVYILQDALLESISKYDPSKGATFSYFVDKMCLWALSKFSRRKRKEVSLQTPIFDGDSELIDRIPDSSSSKTSNHDKLQLHKALNCLDDRQRDIIVKRFGLDGDIITLEQLSLEHGLTRERIRQLQIQALKKLRGVFDPF